MKSTFALMALNEIGERTQTVRSDARPNRGGLKIARLKIARWPATALVLGLASPSNAQVIPSTTELLASPWNTQRVFEPSSLPDMTDRDTRDEIQLEDMPVKKRQQPGYEPVGIRTGSWMFNPALISGALFDSNVFSSNT